MASILNPTWSWILFWNVPDSWILHSEKSALVMTTLAYTRVYPKVSGLTSWSENWKWYSSVPIGAIVSLFVSQSCEFYRHNPLYCFLTSVHCCCCCCFVIYFVIDSVRKLLDTLSCFIGSCLMRLRFYSNMPTVLLPNSGFLRFVFGLFTSFPARFACV
jgi:hypothetical protein